MRPYYYRKFAQNDSLKDQVRKWLEENWPILLAALGGGVGGGVVGYFVGPKGRKTVSTAIGTAAGTGLGAGLAALIKYWPSGAAAAETGSQSGAATAAAETPPAARGLPPDVVLSRLGRMAISAFRPVGEAAQHAARFFLKPVLSPSKKPTNLPPHSTQSEPGEPTPPPPPPMAPDEPGFRPPIRRVPPHILESNEPPSPPARLSPRMEKLLKQIGYEAAATVRDALKYGPRSLEGLFIGPVPPPPPEPPPHQQSRVGRWALGQIERLGRQAIEETARNVRDNIRYFGNALESFLE